MDNINKIDERIRQKLLYETYKDMQCPVCLQKIPIKGILNQRSTIIPRALF